MLAKKRGFCPGVQQAIEKAKSAIREYQVVYSLGPIIHNTQVVNELRDQGLQIVDSVDDVPDDSAILIRSHGVAPEIIEHAKNRGLTIIDATCVLVKRAQNIVRKLDDEGYNIVVVGNPNHPEIQGIVGYAKNVSIIQTDSQLAGLPHSGKMGVVGQTTLGTDKLAMAASKMIEYGFSEVRFINTLCQQAIGRQNAAKELAEKVDVMFVLGGMHSSNTGELARIVENCGTKTYHLEDFSQFDCGMIGEASDIGITAGASTPESVVQEFVRGLETL